MGLRPQSIGSVMSFGFAGSYSRQPDMVVTTAPLEGSVDILFGTPLVRGSDGGRLRSAFQFRVHYCNTLKSG